MCFFTSNFRETLSQSPSTNRYVLVFLLWTMDPEEPDTHPIEYVCELVKADVFKLVALYGDYAGIWCRGCKALQSELEYVGIVE